MPIETIAILGTGLIGASAGLALGAQGFAGRITGWDPDEEQLHTALSRGAVTTTAEDPLDAAANSDVTVLGGPVFTIVEWLDRLATVLREGQLVTDVGSVKGVLCHHTRGRYNGPQQPLFLPGHPMAGKEVGGAANADAGLFAGSAWLFTPCPNPQVSPAAQAMAIEWRGWVERFGARVMEMDPDRHDVLCAWISHMPQFVSTAMCALLEEEFAANPDLLPIGGRALREMTRLGASPFSMWRDIAHTNSEAIARSLQALEQRLAHLRENLRTPELRDEFAEANKFRVRGADPQK